jgi:hypothetical protein
LAGEIPKGEAILEDDSCGINEEHPPLARRSKVMLTHSERSTDRHGNESRPTDKESSRISNRARRADVAIASREIQNTRPR